MSFIRHACALALLLSFGALAAPASATVIVPVTTQNLSGISGVASDGAGGYVVTGQLTQHVSAAGTVTAFGSAPGNGFDLADAPGGIAMSGNNGTVYLLDRATGTPATIATGIDGLRGITAYNGGYAVLAETTDGQARLLRVAPDGTQTPVASGPALGDVIGVAARGGDLFVTDRQGGRLVRVTPAGDVSTFASGLGGPAGIARNFLDNGFVVADYSVGTYPFEGHDVTGQRLLNVSDAGDVSLLAVIPSNFANRLDVIPDGPLSYVVSDPGAFDQPGRLLRVVLPEPSPAGACAAAFAWSLCRRRRNR